MHYFIKDLDNGTNARYKRENNEILLDKGCDVKCATLILENEAYLGRDVIYKEVENEDDGKNYHMISHYYLLTSSPQKFMNSAGLNLRKELVNYLDAYTIYSFIKDDATKEELIESHAEFLIDNAQNKADRVMVFENKNVYILHPPRFFFKYDAELIPKEVKDMDYGATITFYGKDISRTKSKKLRNKFPKHKFDLNKFVRKV